LVTDIEGLARDDPEAGFNGNLVDWGERGEKGGDTGIVKLGEDFSTRRFNVLKGEVGGSERLGSLGGLLGEKPMGLTRVNGVREDRAMARGEPGEEVGDEAYPIVIADGGELGFDLFLRDHREFSA